jgi:phosphonate transport system substrate-binding protein
MKFLAASWLALLGLIIPAYTTGPQGPSDNDDSIVRFGFHGIILEDTNPKDALAATKVWADTIGVKDGLWERSEARIFHDLSALVKAVNKNELDIFALATADYIAVENKLEATPALTFLTAGSMEAEYIILTHRELGAEAVGALKDKRINIVASGGANILSETWCDVLLQEAGLGTPEDLFSVSKRVRKASQAILPVFFKQIDAALVTRSAFETAVELNPQLGRRLQVIASSKPYVPVVVCIRNNLDEDLKRRYLDYATELHKHPNAMQTFVIFRLTQLVRWRPQYLINVRKLLEKHREISGSKRQITASSKSGNKK